MSPSAPGNLPVPPVDDGLALDPEIQTFRRRLSALYAQHPSMDSVPLAEARRIGELVRAPFARGGPAMVRTIELAVPTRGQPVRVRIHVPADVATPMPAMVYTHGGGWRLFSIDTHDRLMREYAAGAGVAVIGIDYARSPEAPYPQALHQVIDAFAWVQAHAADYGIDGQRIALGGDSAGANLALSTAIALRAAGHATAPRALVLNYGTFRRDTSSASHRLYTGADYSLTSDEMTGFWRDYLGAGCDAPERDPLAEPLHASLDQLRGLPPSYLAIAQCDVLRDDSTEMVERLAKAGVDVRSVMYEGATHSFLEAMSIAGISRRALAETCAWLRLQLA